MEYSDLSPDVVEAMTMPQFNLRVMCFYNLLALRQGVDPDNPTKEQQEGATGPSSRKVSGSEAASLLTKLSNIRKEAAEGEKE